jgi:hypothetical protein
VIVGAASGCCAIELRAVATALPSLSAGNIQPMPVVKPAVIIDAIAIASTAELSIFSSFILLLRFYSFNSFCMFLYGCCNINSCQNAKYVSLYHTCKQAEQLHYNRDEQWCNG